MPFVIFSTDAWVLENLKKPGDIAGTLSHLNIDPTLYSVMCRKTDYSSGDYGSLVSRQDWRKPPLVYLKSGTVWDGEASQPVPSDEAGRIILPLEKYMY